MIKEHDQQAKANTTPMKLVYDEYKEENSDSSGTKNLSERLSNETSPHLRRSVRLESRGKSKAKPREEKATPQGRRRERRGSSSNIDDEGNPEDSWEDLSTPYKKPKHTPFTTRITRFKYHEKAKLSRNVKVYEGSKDPKDHLGIFSATVKQEE
ncbi:hypothetical protein Tco_0876884 [Tanacetum coccineum]|uniref:Reverse transcriptase domain-containing protein n=1 Tax=Tanacetum coccineum TaxID=301880 RepID=A0ABQ5BWQ7_9ASTR